jgi:hypothetical protein
VRRILRLLTIPAVALGMVGTASAQRGRHGRPATTGLEHAEATASPRGQRGIENAEAKQAAHKKINKKKINKAKAKHSKQHHNSGR